MRDGALKIVKKYNKVSFYMGRWTMDHDQEERKGQWAHHRTGPMVCRYSQICDIGDEFGAIKKRPLPSSRLM